MTTCDAIARRQAAIHTTRTVTTDVLSGGGIVLRASQTRSSALRPTPVTSAWCNRPRTACLANPKRPSATELPAPDIVGLHVQPCVQTYTNVAGGSKNSLADVAQYYYVTDLRPDLADGDVSPGPGPRGRDRLTSQHMTTFVMEHQA